MIDKNGIYLSVDGDNAVRVIIARLKATVLCS